MSEDDQLTFKGNPLESESSLDSPKDVRYLMRSAIDVDRFNADAEKLGSDTALGRLFRGEYTKGEGDG